MERLEALFEMISAAGFPTVYRAWPEGKAPALPFVCFLEVGSNNFAADDVVYLGKGEVNVELYTREKDPVAEARVEAALSGVVWEKTEDYIESERCYMVTYSFEF